MDTELNLCMGCMNELDEHGVCHYCSYTDDIPHLQSYLAPHTVLNDRYIVGKMLTYNGEGASYICYDTVAKTKAVIREYMPDTLCEREMNSNNIVINPECLAKYKTYMSEFQDMNRTLTRMRNVKSICTAKDMFNENNTCYVILEYVEGVSLKKFLQANRGYLRWEQVRKLFMPLFTTLSIIHNSGIIHRGISPENIIVTTQGELKLTGFSISSIRSTGTALSPEFYSGFTAPEQYSSLEWQGTWTDVYSIGAVLYRILTGYVPPDAFNRMNNDTMIPANRINQHIPRHVSNVLMNAMEVRSSDRIRTINDLINDLFDETPAPTAHVKGATQTIPVVKPQHIVPPEPEPYEPPMQERRRTGYDNRRKKQQSTLLSVLVFILLGLLLVLGIIMLYQVFKPQEDYVDDDPVIYTNATDDDDSEKLITEAPVSTPDAQTASEGSKYGTGAIMPNVVGQRLETIERELGTSFTIRTKIFYSETDEKGVVYSQSIPEGADYDPKKLNKLVLKVCMGPPKVKIPDFNGYAKKDYLNLLNEMNIIYVTEDQASETVPEGYVINTNPETGKLINIEKGDVLVVYVSSGPPKVTTAQAAETTAEQPPVTEETEPTWEWNWYEPTGSEQ
ncbi:MAG: PASTA domain-containing protein [Ruminococcus sp.]|nr:PASTA domain-containing protein [Ruminococcus sp.]